MSKIYFIVPAAGLGNRFESNLPKQYSRVGHESVIERTVNRLSLTDPEKIIIPISAKDELFASQSFSHPDLIIKASGGPSRQASVLNALNESLYLFQQIHHVLIKNIDHRVWLF